MGKKSKPCLEIPAPMSKLRVNVDGNNILVTIHAFGTIKDTNGMFANDPANAIVDIKSSNVGYSVTMTCSEDNLNKSWESARRILEKLQPVCDNVPASAIERLKHCSPSQIKKKATGSKPSVLAPLDVLLVGDETYIFRTGRYSGQQTKAEQLLIEYAAFNARKLKRFPLGVDNTHATVLQADINVYGQRAQKLESLLQPPYDPDEIANTYHLCFEDFVRLERLLNVAVKSMQPDDMRANYRASCYVSLASTLHHQMRLQAQLSNHTANYAPVLAFCRAKQQEIMDLYQKLIQMPEEIPQINGSQICDTEHEARVETLQQLCYSASVITQEAERYYADAKIVSNTLNNDGYQITPELALDLLVKQDRFEEARLLTQYILQRDLSDPLSVLQPVYYISPLVRENLNPLSVEVQDEQSS